VSAKDVILEMLRRHGVKGGVNTEEVLSQLGYSEERITDRIIEYHGPGLVALEAMDRHVIANMGADLGVTTTVFPADEAVQRFLRAEGRGRDYVPILGEPDAEDAIDLSRLEPLIAGPSSLGNVVPVREVEGAEVFQVVVGSSANPGLRDFAVVAEILRGYQTHDQVSFDVNPTSRQILQELAGGGWLFDLIASGARIHQSGCMGCIGMGQAHATGGTACAPSPATSRAARAPKATWCGCAHRKPRRPPLSPARSATPPPARPARHRLRGRDAAGAFAGEHVHAGPAPARRVGPRRAAGEGPEHRFAARLRAAP
jgi:aconitate hydratase